MRSGDDAFLKALGPVHDRLYRYALAVMADEDDAKDLVADTILAAYEQFERLREPAKFANFLFAIASKKSKRKLFRQKRFARIDERMISSLEAKGLGVEAAADLSILLDLLQKLPARMRETVVLYEIADLTLAEIRDVQGGTLSGVKSRLTRGRQKLVELTETPKAALRAPDTPAPSTHSMSAAPVILGGPYGR